MNDIREKFEEIWPVPEGVFWSPRDGAYIATNKATDLIIGEYNARLDTFTRCKETMAPVMSLIEEMVAELEHVALYAYGCTPTQTQGLIDRAEQILGRE
jgi:hypothetical protein